MDSLKMTRTLFYIKVHEAKKALIKDNGCVPSPVLYIIVFCIPWSIIQIYLLFTDTI